MVSNGVDTCRQVPVCWHASQCPWHRRGRCLFRHRDADADVKPPVTRTEEEIVVELAAFWEAVSKLASSLMWRAGLFVDVPVPQVMEEPAMKQLDDWSVPQVVEESTVERIDGLPVCGDSTEGSDVGVHGQQVEEAVSEVVVELAVPSGEATSCGPGECDVTSGAATAVASPVVCSAFWDLQRVVRRQNQYAQCLLVKLDFPGPEGRGLDQHSGSGSNRKVCC